MGQTGWDRQWRDPEPKKEYDVIIIGAGLHGLATAFYLAKNHNITNVAVLEKGWLGGGNAGRNTKQMLRIPGKCNVKCKGNAKDL